MRVAFVAALGAVIAMPAAAEPAAGVDVFQGPRGWTMLSSDSDHTEVLKIGTNLDWVSNGADQHAGVRPRKGVVQADWTART